MNASSILNKVKNSSLEKISTDGVAVVARRTFLNSLVYYSTFERVHTNLQLKEEGGIWHSISTCTRTLVKVLVASCKFITIFMCLNYYKIVTCV
jgi:hypothetical protein